MIVLDIRFDFDYIPLLVILALAWLLPVILSLTKFDKIPCIILQIIAGYIAGRFLLGILSPETEAILDFLALTGFLFLMFMSGLEIDVDQILYSFPRRRITYARFLKNPLLVGFAFFLITLLLAYSGTLLLARFVEITNSFYFSLILVTTSVGIIVPVIKTRGEINTRYGQMIILAAAVADIFSILLFSFTAFTIKNGFRIEILFILILFAAFLILYRLGKRLVKIKLVSRIKFELEHAASQITIRSSLLIILIFVVLAQLIGEEVLLLGAFLGGLLLSFFLHKDRSVLLLKLDGMGYGFFIPLFFIMVGVKFDSSSLKDFDQSLFLYLVLLLAILYLVKIIPSFLWSRLFGRRRAISGGILMASRLSLIIAASQIGLDMGIITPGMNASFIIMAVITCMISPIVFNNLTPQKKYRGDETVIVGGSSTGVLLARRLEMHRKPAVIIENNKQRYEEIKAKGLKVILGDGSELSVYRTINLSPSSYIVVGTSDDEMNLKICRLLKEEFGHENIITRSAASPVNQYLINLNVSMLDVRRTLAATLENLILRPATYQALVETFENFNVEEIKITSDRIHNTTVKEIPFHKDGSLILIRRGEDMLIPHGDTILKKGDNIVVFATSAAMIDFRKILS